MIDSLNAIVYSILALIPGYIMDSLIRIKIPLGKGDSNFAIHRFIVLSVLNYLPWLWTLVPNLFLRDFSEIPLRKIDVYFLVFVLFVSPIIWSFLITKFNQYKTTRLLLNLLGFPLNLMIPDAWDFIFSQLPPCYLIVVLKDGNKVLGYYGENSYATAGSDGKSLYLERIYSLDKNEKWIERERTNGIIICEEQISYVEIIN
ncbi:MAG: hypothetical protein HFG27_08340 [Provencibacterium sp.]|nr:hypothetical protein [Provencibacterium sp.]